MPSNEGRDAMVLKYRNKVLLGVRYANRQAMVHLRGGSADQDEFAASIRSSRELSHCARQGEVTFI